ncbi:DUF6538 domain-containing protein [Afifella marina]
MASPRRNPTTGIYELRKRVPADLREKARGRMITLPVAGEPRRVRAGAEVKVSLSTREATEAKKRFREAEVALEGFWEALRNGPQKLSHKQALALAGEVRAEWIAAFDEEPATEAIWQNVIRANALAQEGRRTPLSIPTEHERDLAIEKRFGKITDIWLSLRGLEIDSVSRWRVLEHVARSMDDVARVNRQKATGDYSDTGETNRYPEFEAPKPAAVPPSGVMFAEIIKKEAEIRSRGKDSEPLPKNTIDKFTRHTREFAKFIGSERASDTTRQKAAAWLDHMREEADKGKKLSNKTMGDKLASLKAVLGWGRQHDFGFFPEGNPVSGIRPPTARSIPQGSRTFTLVEARAILQACRAETEPERRWLPWLMAYSGARINEVAGLTRDDFFERDGDSFYHIRSNAVRRIKTRTSERRVPLHPAIVEEGFLAFLKEQKKGVRLFDNRADEALRKWVGRELLTRDVPPNHGWRHLFEDLCTNAGRRSYAEASAMAKVLPRSSRGTRTISSPCSSVSRWG